MGERLSTQLEILQRERERLEELLMLDANWRALRQLEARERAGDPLHAVDGAGVRASLVEALSSNRLFAARAKLIETIELLASLPLDGEEPRVRPSGTLAGAEPVSSRIVLLSQPVSGNLRARVRLKPADDVVPPTPQPWHAARNEPSPGGPAAVPDALELIEGLGRRAVELLQSHGVTKFADIAAWMPADAAMWRARLDGVAEGHPSAWIEQAALLATGRETYYAARVRRGEFACLVPPPAPEPPRPAVPSAVEPMAAVSPETASAATAHSPAEVDEERPPLLSRLSLRRRGFARPGEPPLVPPEPVVPERALPAIEPSDVIVITRPATAEPASEAAAASPGEHPNRLVRRLKQLGAEDRFSASGYAAYRGEVEEASVTIVGREAERPSGAKADGERTAAARPVSRFLRALTGRG